MYFQGSEVNNKGQLESLSHEFRPKVMVGSSCIVLSSGAAHLPVLCPQRGREVQSVTVQERWLQQHQFWTYCFTNEQSAKFNRFIWSLDNQLTYKLSYILHFLSHSPICDTSIAPFLSGYKLFRDLWLNFLMWECFRTN